MYYKSDSKFKVFLKFLGKLVITFIIATISIVLYDMYRNIEVESVQTPEDNEYKENIENNTEIYSVIEDVSSTVVGISKLQSVDSSFFSIEAAKTYNLGTGTIIAKEGYVLTNNHITGNVYSKCYITLKDGTELTGNVIWTDEYLDLSIIKVNTTREMQYVELGDSDNLKVGQTVYAIGNPLGVDFQRTVTSGIISAKNRTIKIEEEEKVNYMEELIQTDASINNGNSGGPLIDVNGKVIGITTVKIKEAEGIGFAVPINIIKPIIEKIINTKKFEEASLGIFGYDKEAVKYIDSTLNIENGIYVSDLVLGGSAKVAGIKIGDIIEKIDNIELNKINDLRKYIYTKDVGDEVKLVILRNKQPIEVTVRLKKK